MKSLLFISGLFILIAACGKMEEAQQRQNPEKAYHPVRVEGSGKAPFIAACNALADLETALRAGRIRDPFKMTLKQKGCKMDNTFEDWEAKIAHKDGVYELGYSGGAEQIPTASYGMVSEICKKVRGALETPLKVDSINVVAFSSFDSKFCQNIPGHVACIYVEEGPLNSAGTKYTAHTRHYAKFILSGPKRGFYSYYEQVSSFYCPENDRLEKVVQLKF